MEQTKNTLINIDVTNEFVGTIRAEVLNAARQVGRREAKRANVYLLAEMGTAFDADGSAIPELKVVTTFDNTVPGLYALLIASTRWSVSKGEYVATVNNLLGSAWHGLLSEDIYDGRVAGVKEYDSAQEEYTNIERIKALKPVMVNCVSLPDSNFARTASYYANEQDAIDTLTLGAIEGKVWTKEFIAKESTDTSKEVISICTHLELNGLWVVYMS